MVPGRYINHSPPGSQELEGTQLSDASYCQSVAETRAGDPFGCGLPLDKAAKWMAMCEIHPYRGLTRRSFIHMGAGAAAGLTAFPGLTEFQRWSADSVSNPLETALAAERWIRAHRIETAFGVSWPWNPGSPEVVTNLYTGTPGVVLFYLELFHATGNRKFLDEARAGAVELSATIPESAPVEPGLYVGLGGIGFTLAEVAIATGDESLRLAALRSFELVTQSAVELPGGIGWPSPAGDQDVEVTDIVSGASGAGLALLYAHDRLGFDDGLEYATRAGDRLMALGYDSPAGKKWKIYEGYTRWMPNFSHGTAGVSYFLSQLYHATGEARFLDAAIAGARHLESIATTGDNWWRIAHHEPGGENLFYLSWCHGPPGTSRLFYSLANTSADEGWMERVVNGARGVMDAGVPERRTPGFWNNVSQCCGDAGVAGIFHSHRTNHAGSVSFRFCRSHRKTYCSAWHYRWKRNEMGPSRTPCQARVVAGTGRLHARSCRNRFVVCPR